MTTHQTFLMPFCLRHRGYFAMSLPVEASTKLDEIDLGNLEKSGALRSEVKVNGDLKGEY